MALLVTRAARGSEVSLPSGKQKVFKPTCVNLSEVFYLSLSGPRAHRDHTAYYLSGNISELTTRRHMKNIE